MNPTLSTPTIRQRRAAHGSLLLALALGGSAVAAGAAPPTTAPYWVYLVDRPAAAVEPSQTSLTGRALARRAARRSDGRLVDERDLPLVERHVAGIVAQGAKLRVRSRWLNAVSVDATPAQARRLTALPWVRAVAPVRRAIAPPIDEAPAPLDGGLAGEDFYGLAQAQLEQIDLPALHARGFTGAGIVIGVLDTGFNRVHEAFHHPEKPLQVLAEWDFVNDDPNTGIDPGDPSTQHRHGTWVLGCLAAYLPGAYVGAAYDAAYVLAKTEVVTSETPIEEDYFVAGLEFIEANGADIATSSLAYYDWYEPADMDGQTAVTTIAVNIATANGVVCLTAAGNRGHDSNPATFTIGAPADAFEVITVGAVRDTGLIAPFSSDGPTADGRQKPEVLARGFEVSTINSTNPSTFTTVSGTSFSTPLVAGAVACILQARPEWGVASLRENLIAGAGDILLGPVPDPLFIRGWGIIRADVTSRLGTFSADLDRDGIVAGGDLGLLLAAWGTCADCADCTGDLDGDCVVDGVDLGLLLASWDQ